MNRNLAVAFPALLSLRIPRYLSFSQTTIRSLKLKAQIIELGTFRPNRFGNIASQVNLCKVRLATKEQTSAPFKCILDHSENCVGPIASQYCLYAPKLFMHFIGLNVYGRFLLLRYKNYFW